MRENLCYDGGTCRHSDLIDQLRAENAKLREALKAVEWVEYPQFDGSPVYYCEGCRRLRKDGHTPDCIIGNALGGSHE